MKIGLSSLYIIFLFSCSTTQKMKQTQNEIDLQGHRGCRGLMPENTISAMLHALELGVTTLEMDVVITKDKQVILSHEPFFNHEITTLPNGAYVTEKEEKSLNIFKLNYDEIIQYDIGLKPHPRFPKQQKLKAIKPTLNTVFDSVKNWCSIHHKKMPYFNIETKCLPISDNMYHPQPAEFVDLLVQVIEDNKMQSLTNLQSFDFRTLQYAHQKYPHIKTAMLIEDDDSLTFEEQIKKIGFVPAIYSPHFSLVNEALVKQCHNKKMKLIPWTVNTSEAMKKLIGLGVDGIITDYPDLFKN